MGIIANMRALFGRQEVRLYGVPDVHVSVDGVSTERMYATQPALKTVVDYLARNVAQLPLKVYRRDGDDRVRDREGTIARLVADPNPDMTRYELVRDTVCDLKLYDFAIWVVGRDANSPSGWQIRPVPVAWVTEWVGDGFAYDRFVFTDGRGARVDVDASSCVVFHGYSPADPRSGSPAVRALRETIREQMSAQQFRRSTWENGMRITGYIKRPPTVEPWLPEARARFAESVRAAWGKGGERAGGTPVFEDGMEYHNVEFNSREKDWAQGVQLSREEVAAAFHVNPALIWHTEGQTYASAKDNARALYADTLAPDLEFIQSRATKRLSEITGETGVFCEFDLQAKLQGSFEEQASSLQSSVGAPWMTRNEARARMNLPAVDGGDELITPLNVTEGGLASPNDTDPTQARYNAARAQHTRELERMWAVPACCAGPAEKGLGAASAGTEGLQQADVLVKAVPGESTVETMVDVFARFYSRQGRSVVSSIAATPVDKLLPGDEEHGVPSWWDQGRWSRELADDLEKSVYDQMVASARESAERLGGVFDADDELGLKSVAEDLCRRRAAQANQSALTRALSVVQDAGGKVTPRSAASAVGADYEALAASRAERNGRSLAQACANAGIEEGAKRSGVKCKKTWRTTSPNPRDTHARMNGETVKIGHKFSNGAKYPGDPALPAEETCNCRCRLDIVKDAKPKPRKGGEVRIDSRQFGKKVGEHASDFGFTPRDMQDPDKREAYADVLRGIIDDGDEFVWGIVWGGQDGQCEAYIRDGLAVVVDDDGEFVTAFRETDEGNRRINHARRKNELVGGQ